MMKRINKYFKKNGGVVNSFKALFASINEYGGKDIFLRIFFPNGYSDKQYRRWIKLYDQPLSKAEIEHSLRSLNEKPLISVLVPVYNVKKKYLTACVNSVVEQYYSNWELILVDDCSTEQYIKPYLEELAAADERIKVIFRKENGHISAATNSALEVAKGEYIALLDNDDFIKPEALLEVVKLINAHPDADMIYSDEDKVNASGKSRRGAFFKPDWSPDAFWGHMYLCHLGVYRTTLAKEIGGMRIGYEGAQDYDFVLRFTELTKNIYHIPKILYHWRMIPTSTASDASSKNYAFDASIKAKKDALTRRGYKAVIEENEKIHSTNIFFQPDENDYVSIIIPTKNHGSDIEKCITSIIEKSTWSNYEIIIVDNGSDDANSLKIFNEFDEKYENISILNLPIPFNYSRLNNEAVKIAKGNLVLFLNNDTEIITKDWLERMIGQAKLPYTGAVGAKLLYGVEEDYTIQHSGVIMYDIGPGHAFHNFHRGNLGYFGRLVLNYNYSAVTGACLMIEKSKFNLVGGFDEENLAIAYNDIDLCFSLLKKGLYNVVRADVELYHYESKSRGYEDTPEKIERFNKEKKFLEQKWRAYFNEGDPFYNPNLIGDNPNFNFKQEI